MCEYCGLSHIPSFPLLAVYKESAYCGEPRNYTVGQVAFETVQKLYKIIVLALDLNEIKLYSKTSFLWTSK